MASYDLSLRRKQDIENNLLALMQEIPYDRIPVKDLTDNMQIARKTFYHYFHNKQACLESLIDRTLLESSLCLMTLPKDAGPQEIYRERLLFWIRNKSFLDVIRQNNLSFIFIDRAMHYVRQEDASIQSRLSTRALACDEDVLYGYISGQVCLILKWSSEGFVRSVEEMVQVSLRLAQEPLLAQKTE